MLRAIVMFIGLSNEWPHSLELVLAACPAGLGFVVGLGIQCPLAYLTWQVLQVAACA